MVDIATVIFKINCVLFRLGKEFVRTHPKEIVFFGLHKERDFTKNLNALTHKFVSRALKGNRIDGFDGWFLEVDRFESLT